MIPEENLRATNYLLKDITDVFVPNISLSSSHLMTNEIFPCSILGEKIIPSIGSSCTCEFVNNIVTSADGGERRRAIFSTSRNRYSLYFGARPIAQCMGLLSFFQSKMGRLIGFFYDDPFDYPITKEIGRGDGIKTHFEIFSEFYDEKTNDNTEMIWINNRIVRKKHKFRISSNIRVLIGDREVNKSSFDVKDTIVTFDEPPKNESPIFVEFKILVPVRFDSDAISIEFGNEGTGMISDVKLVEIFADFV